MMDMTTCFCRVYKKGVCCCASIALVANVARQAIETGGSRKEDGWGAR